MKKFLAGIAAAAIITVPMTSFALESMSKGALKKATGQAGVSIALDNVVIVQKSMPTTTYWDVDGTSSVQGTVGGIKKAGLQISYADATGAAAGNAQKLIVLDGILDADKYGTDDLNSTFKITDNAVFSGISQVGIVEKPASGALAGIDVSNGDDLAGTAGVYRTGISPLTIDVGTCAALTTGLDYNRGESNYDVAGVVIGLPTLEITTYHSNDIKVISVVTDDTKSTGGNVTANNGKTVPTISNELIRIEKSGVSQMAILGGRLEIAPH